MKIFFCQIVRQYYIKESSRLNLLSKLLSSEGQHDRNEDKLESNTSFYCDMIQ